MPADEACTLRNRDGELMIDIDLTKTTLHKQSVCYFKEK